MSNGVYRLVCSGCKKVLKVELSETPDQDFQLDCPRCRNPVTVRAAAVHAAMMRPAPPGTRPSESTGLWEAEAGPEASAPSTTMPSAAAGNPEFGARDMTSAILEMQTERETVAPVETVPPPPPPASAPIRSSRAVPSNAPRTTPRAPGEHAPPPWGIVAAVGGGALLLVLIGGGLLVHRFTGRSGGPAAAATPLPSTVESDASVRKDIAALKAAYPDPGGAAQDLFAQGLASLRGDSAADHRDAAEKFRRAIAADPANAEPLAALAMALTFLPRSERGGLGVTQANQWADYVQRTQPASLLGQASRAVLLSSLGRDADALSLADAQRAAHPDDALAWFVHGWILRRKDPAAAAQSFRKALALDGGFRHAQTELAAAELAAGHRRAAQEALDARFAAGTPSGSAEHVWGNLDAALGDVTSARKHLEQSILLEPKDADARLDAGWLAARAGDAAMAREQAQHVLEIERPALDASDAQAADAELLLAEAARRESKFQEAMTAAREAVRTHPSHAAAQYGLGLALLGAGRGDEAAEALKTAAQKDPARTVIQLALAMAQAKANRVEDAIAAYQAALAIDPDDARAHVGLAMTWVDADLPTKAMEELTRAAELSHPLSPFLRLEDVRFPPPPFDVEASRKRLRKIESSDPNRDSRYDVWEGMLLCLGGRFAEGVSKMSVPGLESSTAATVAGWALVAGRPADAVRVSARADGARELVTRGWALRMAKVAGDERAFDTALAADPNEPYAALGKAQSLLAHGKKKEALALLAIAEKKLGAAPAFLKIKMAAE